MKLFLPQTQLEEWALGDKADLKDGKLVVMVEDGATFPAVLVQSSLFWLS